MDRHLITIITDQDGQFNEEINAYVSIYQVDDDEVAIEFEYINQDNEDEVIEVKRFTLTVQET